MKGVKRSDPILDKPSQIKMNTSKENIYSLHELAKPIKRQVYHKINDQIK
jgi:hypothetical protein